MESLLYFNRSEELDPGASVRFPLFSYVFMDGTDFLERHLCAWAVSNISDLAR